jgi:hypothetical protein
MDQWEINLVKRQERRLRKERMRLRIRETLAGADSLEKLNRLQMIMDEIDREIADIKQSAGGPITSSWRATARRADQRFWRAAKNKVSRLISKGRGAYGRHNGEDAYQLTE